MAIKSNLFIISTFLAVLSIFADPITNICDLIGIPLSSNVWDRIPVRDRTTLDNVFLGSIRSFLTGNLTDVKFYFTDDLWKVATGLESVPMSFPNVLESCEKEQHHDNA